MHHIVRVGGRLALRASDRRVSPIEDDMQTAALVAHVVAQGDVDRHVRDVVVEGDPRARVARVPSNEEVDVKAAIGRLCDLGRGSCHGLTRSVGPLGRLRALDFEHLIR